MVIIGVDDSCCRVCCCTPWCCFCTWNVAEKQDFRSVCPVGRHLLIAGNHVPTDPLILGHGQVLVVATIPQGPRQVCRRDGSCTVRQQPRAGAPDRQQTPAKEVRNLLRVVSPSPPARCCCRRRQDVAVCLPRGAVRCLRGCRAWRALALAVRQFLCETLTQCARANTPTPTPHPPTSGRFRALGRVCEYAGVVRRLERDEQLELTKPAGKSNKNKRQGKT